MTIQFPPLEPWQEDVYEDIKDARGNGKIYLVVSKRQVGKTVLATIVTMSFALGKPNTTVGIIQPTLPQSRRVFKQLLNMLNQTKLVKHSNGTTLEISLLNGSEIIFKSGEQKDALRGMTLDLLIIDEGAFISDEIYEILFPTVDARQAPILLISTPLFQSGKFYELFKQGIENDEYVKVYDWSTYDTSKYLSNDKLEYYKNTLTEGKFTSEYLGKFIVEGGYVFKNVKKCILRGKNNNPAVVAGIDWGAGDGNDYTVITMLDKDGKMVAQDFFNKLEPTAQIERISKMIANHPSLEQINVEMNSIGTVYYDMLKNRIKKPILRKFNTTNESKRRIIEQLAKAFLEGTVAVYFEVETMKQLEHYAMEKTSKGYTYNGISGYHDDFVISLALAYDLLPQANMARGKYNIIKC